MIVDIENVVIQLYLALGCNLNAAINHKYDAFRLGLTFCAASLIIYWTIKIIYMTCVNTYRGVKKL